MKNDAKTEEELTCQFEINMGNLANFLLIQSRKCTSLEFTGEFCAMKRKSDTKFEDELTCQFKIDMRNLTNFDPSTRKSQKFAL